jgi:thioredoxin 1
MINEPRIGKTSTDKKVMSSAPGQTADTIVTLSHADFRERVLEGDGPIVVEFMSLTCSHCQAIAPVLQQVADKLRESEQIFRVDIDAEPDLASNFGIDGTPTLVLFDEGQEVGRVVGPTPEFDSLLASLTEPFKD